MGTVRCVAGVANGTGFRLPEGNEIIVGSDAGRSSLVISDSLISGTHCTIKYQAALDSYTVTDHSTNGTYVEDYRLDKDVPTPVPAGTVIAFADKKNRIQLG